MRKCLLFVSVLGSRNASSLFFVHLKDHSMSYTEHQRNKGHGLSPRGSHVEPLSFQMSKAGGTNLSTSPTIPASLLVFVGLHRSRTKPLWCAHIFMDGDSTSLWPWNQRSERLSYHTPFGACFLCCLIWKHKPKQQDTLVLADPRQRRDLGSSLFHLWSLQGTTCLSACQCQHHLWYSVKESWDRRQCWMATKIRAKVQAYL